jgi:flagellar motor switch/type III secretory pathway protein FliN
MLRRREFIAMSPAGWKLFVVNPHPTGDRAVLDVDPSLVTELRQRILGAAGIEKSNRGVPSDDAILGFVLLSLLERANRTLEFPVQFSFGRGDPKSLADGTRGVVLTSAVSVGGLTGYFRLFLPLRFLSTCMPESAAKPEASYPSGLSWKFPISAGYVDLLSPEMEQIGIGDILVTEDEAQVLFPNDFNKSWHLSPDSGNPERFLLDNYFERGLPVQGSNGEAAERNKPDIESLPLRLHVIVGEKEFTIAEVQSLNPGTVVELDTNKSDPVRLMVNGKVLGEGELVEVEGKLAVKVLGWRSA